MVSAKMTGDQEVPSVSTNALGVASITFNSARDTAYFNASVNGLSGAITGIHIHEGAAGTNGPVVVDLSPGIEGNRIVYTLTGSDLTPATVAKLLSGKMYLNVHTAMNPNGEIRGQLVLEKDQAFHVTLDTAQQTHSVNNQAFGTAVFNLSHNKAEIEFELVADSLSGAITAAHLHFGAAGQAGPVAVDLSSFISGNRISGTLQTSAGPIGLLDSMMAGNIYVNVHTMANPAGEIRGQVKMSPYLNFDAFLNTAQEIPAPSGSNATGVAWFSVSQTMDTLWYEVQAEGLTGSITGAHIHLGSLGNTGGVAIDLSSGITQGSRIKGMITGSSINPGIVNTMLSGGTYLNLHTTANPAGEIRGQVYRLAREAYSFSLEGEQEVPSVFTTARGSGLVTIDRDQSNAHIMMVTSDLTGPLTGAHFHVGETGVNGPVVYNLTPLFSQTGVDDAAFGYWTSADMPAFMTSNSAQFRHDSIYVNLHTAANPGGELRGQVLRGDVGFAHLSYENGERPYDPQFTKNMLFSAKMTGDQEVPPVMTSALGVAGFSLNPTLDTIFVNATADGLSGSITGIHVHEGLPGTSGSVVHDLSNGIEGNKVTGFITGFDLGKFIRGEYYLNLHTAANPTGEIRGQINFETSTTFTNEANGAQEVPPATGNGFGRAVFNLSADQSFLEFKVQATGLTGAITGAHLHVGAPGVAGAVVEDLTPFIDGFNIEGVVMPSAYLSDLLAGDIYLNIHTADNPAGEIRAQLIQEKNMSFDATLNGAQEAPAAEAPGKGVASMYFSDGMDSLYYDIVVNKLSGPITGVHIHQGFLGSSGAVVTNLSSNINGNRIQGSITGSDLSPSLVEIMITGEAYINVHTAAFPNGEVRGQIFRNAHDGYAYSACGNQEVPAVTADAYGSGIFSVNREHTKAHVMFTSTDLTGSITGAHLHNAASGSNGPVITDLTQSLNMNSGFAYVDFDSTKTAETKAGNVYLNIHTNANMNGELRGQVLNQDDCPSNTIGLEDASLASIKLYPNPATVNTKLDFGKEVNAEIQVLNLQGQVILTTNFQGSIFELNTQDFASGLYLIQINLDKESYSTRFSVQ